MLQPKKFTLPSEMIYVIVCIWLIALDQWTKQFAFLRNLPTFSYNPGISFGIFDDAPYEMVLTLVVLVIAAVVFLWRKAISHAFYDYPYLAMLFSAGAISNLLDRVFHGGVRDWLPIPFMGIYNNLADWYIFVAMLVLIVLEMKSWYQSKMK